MQGRNRSLTRNDSDSRLKLNLSPNYARINFSAQPGDGSCSCSWRIYNLQAIKLSVIEIRCKLQLSIIKAEIKFAARKRQGLQ